MKKLILYASTLTAAGTLMTGCVTTSQIARPTEVTLQKALHDVGASLKAMKEAEGQNFKTGLIAKDVEVVFKIGVSATDKSSLGIELGAPASSPVSAKLSGSASNENSANRENTITIRYTNLFLENPTTTIIGVSAKSPDDYKKIIDGLEQAGVPVAAPAAPK